MNAAERRRLIDRYAQGHAEVLDALSGFPDKLHSERPIAGKWSAREIVHHLADSETTSALRLRQLLAQAHPVIQGYDQEAYAKALRYNERPDLGPSLEAFGGARATTLQILNGMSEQDWSRAGWHSESGHYTAETWLRIYAAHAHDHADQIRRLRRALGS